MSDDPLSEIKDEPETQTDSALLRKFHATGDEAAFTSLVTRWLPMLEHCARRITGDAELSRDAVQRVFCQLARKAGPLASAGRSPVPWLHRAVTLECRSLLRRERADETRCFTRTALSFADFSEPGTADLLRPAALADRTLMPSFAARWATTDEAAALAWLKTLPAGSMERDIPALAMAGIIAKKDPARAVELIRDLPMSERYELDIADIWRAWRQRDRKAAEAAMASRNFSPKALENLKPNLR